VYEKQHTLVVWHGFLIVALPVSREPGQGIRQRSSPVKEAASALSKTVTWHRLTEAESMGVKDTYIFRRDCDKNSWRLSSQAGVSRAQDQLVDQGHQGKGVLPGLVRCSEEASGSGSIMV